mmetsp:Transcript_33976/g.79120  ORF Transcript_33976/g.79120 Transcript_33976/m.79120 type:complete len:214 (+) Transcript_33976:33-674(+)|eukprot:s735_g22.t1
MVYTVAGKMLNPMKSTASSSAMAKSDSGQKLAAPRALAESPALHRLFDRSRNDETEVKAMMLQGPAGRALLAIGAQDDHDVASRAAANIQRRTEQRPGAKGVHADRPSKALETSKTTLHFGAVYEHRDFSGKPRLIGSTDKVPEQQFELDWSSDAVKSLRKDGMRSELVWAAVGSGVIGAAEMAEVRQSVMDARSDRLKVEKLRGIKPYSRHT